MNGSGQNRDGIIDACQRSLADMQRYVMKRRWDRFADADNSFSDAMQRLKQWCSEHPDQLAGCENSFRDLSQMQRRVMRLVALHMQATSEDVVNLEQSSKGLNQLRQLSLSTGS